jgi:hypothetical protein
MRNILLATTEILILGIAMAVFSSSHFTAAMFGSSSSPYNTDTTMSGSILHPQQHYLL